MISLYISKHRAQHYPALFIVAVACVCVYPVLASVTGTLYMRLMSTVTGLLKAAYSIYASDIHV